jgi:uncharacterized repeat protein (TIGR03803 family)
MKQNMKTKISVLFVAIMFAVGALSPVRAQSTFFIALHSFTNGGDGAHPFCGLILSGNTLYGTANVGGTFGDGTVFSLNVDGSDLISLHSFSATNADGFNGDGTDPYASLILSGNTLYGTAFTGGNAGYGTVFSVETNASGFAPLDSFPTTDDNGFNSQGIFPTAGLTLSGNTLYGTAFEGGAAANGTVFSLSTNGSGFVPIYSFSPVDVYGYNSDGADPFAGLVLSGNTLYGAAAFGGPAGTGTLFSLDSDGSGFDPFYSFSATNAAGVNTDGANVEASLIVSGTRLYGTALYGGAAGNGTVFAMNTDGTGFVPLHSFSLVDSRGENSDGALPDDLILSGNTLYGTAEYGGSFGNGAVFSVNTDGSGFTTLYSFSATNDAGVNYDGINPNGVILSGNTLYGTTINGGSYNGGTVFALALTAQPTITGTTFSGTNLTLTGINAQAGQYYYVLKSTNLALPLNEWTPVATNYLGAAWGFSITATNAVNTNAPQAFYLLQLPQ